MREEINVPISQISYLSKWWDQSASQSQYLAIIHLQNLEQIYTDASVEELERRIYDAEKSYNLPGV